MMKRIIVLLILLLAAIAMHAQDSISTNTEPVFDKFIIKVAPISIFEGEIPIVIEYRPFIELGFQVSGGFVYINPVFNTGHNFCNGYKVVGGLRFYFEQGRKRERTWFLNPQYFYKKMWINNRSYDENNRFPGVGSDRPTKYDYDENRIVYGIELLTGFIKKFDHFIIEIYFGGGVRSIKSDRTITQWHIYKKENVNQYNINYLNPPKNITITTTSPSLQIGVNFSFSLYRKKSRSATF